MKLKCFGCLYDQRYQLVEDHFRQGDMFRVPRCLPLMSVNNMNEAAQDKIAYECDVYIVETFSLPKGNWKFLRYAEMTMEEIFDKIFT